MMIFFGHMILDWEELGLQEIFADWEKKDKGFASSQLVIESENGT